MAIQVLEWADDTGVEMVRRFEPGGDLRFGAQLVVLENQWAVFVRDGRALDTFETGRHTLTTANLPLLTRLLGIPFGGTTPFRADVWFVARKTFPDLRWGTRDPVAFRDAELGVVRLRAHGAFAVRVVHPQVFLNVLVGSQERYATEQIEGYLREILVSRLNDVLGETLRTLLDLPARYDELAEALRGRVADDFAKYGLRLEDLFVHAVTPPEEVQKVLDDRAGMAAAGDPDRYLRFKAARALGDAAAASGGEAGGSAAAGVGLGVGAGLGMMIPGMLQGAARSAPASASASACSCGTTLPEGANFCPGCGAKVGAFCAACGAAVPAAAKFCPGCGAKRA